MATTLHTPIRLRTRTVDVARPEHRLRNRSRNLLITACAALLTPPWLLIALRLPADEIDELFGGSCKA